MPNLQTRFLFSLTLCADTTTDISPLHCFIALVDVCRIISYKVDINMRFRASSSSGLLLWSGRQSDPQEQRDENDDFLALGLDHGYLTLAYNLGSGEAVLRYNLTRLDDDLWHRIRAVRWEQTLHALRYLIPIPSACPPPVFSCRLPLLNDVSIDWERNKWNFNVLS